MKIEKGWHPIFQFLFELFGDLPSHFKYFYHAETKLVIGINSYLEDQGRMNLVLEKRISIEQWEKAEPGEILEIKEQWWLNFKDGSCSCEQELLFKSFTGKATKRAEGKNGPYSPERYNEKNWTWIKDQLDFVLKIIKESKRINPYTEKIQTPEEAKAFDKEMSDRIGRVEDFGAKVRETLQKDKEER